MSLLVILYLYKKKDIIMANVYVFNPDTQLYYLFTASVEESTGIITTSVSQDGIPTDPGYVPGVNDPLTTLEFYLLYFNINASTLNGNQFRLVNNSVSRYVERYCNYSWVDETVPDDLQSLVCHMIRDKLFDVANSTDSRIKQESITNYSYTLNDNFLNKSIFVKYYEDLDLYKVVAFA